MPIEGPQQKCIVCEIASYGETSIAYAFPLEPGSETTRSNVCRYCLNRGGSLNWDIWVLIEDKLSEVPDYPRRWQISLQDEARIRYQISRGSNVYLSDGIRVWRFGTQTSMQWSTFNKVFGPWKRIYPVDPTVELVKDNQSVLSESNLQKLHEKFSL